MEKKEYYRHLLPHYQQPGQTYFVTWSLKDAVPRKALKQYTEKLELLKLQLKTYGYSPDATTRHEMHRLKTAPPELIKQYYAIRKKYITRKIHLSVAKSGVKCYF